MPAWLFDLALGVVCGRLGSFPGWKLLYRAQWNIAQREGWSESMPRHLPGFRALAWLSTGLGGGLAVMTGVPWWSLLCGTLTGGVLAGLAWAVHLISPRKIEDVEPDP